jgi:glutamyl-Q tRNA(Asp) synthetase
MRSRQAPEIVGRFAPSPTGPLHFGSLVAAVGSYLESKSRGGLWLLRIDDLDKERCSQEAADSILRTLEAYGLPWDGEVMYQGMRGEAYVHALKVLAKLGLTYPCGCSRKEIADSGPQLEGAAIYPGTCRGGLRYGKSERVLRIDTQGVVVSFSDAVQGDMTTRLETETGDFVIRRAEGYVAYHLACVVDDAEQGVTEVVRGADLIDSTPRQIFLQKLLGLPEPRYAHLPIAVDRRGDKLSKQTLAPALDPHAPVAPLIRALRFLGQDVPGEAGGGDVADLWRWALASWRADRIPRRFSQTVEQHEDRQTA